MKKRRQKIMRYFLGLISNITRKEIYFRIRRIIVIILIFMVVSSFVAIFTLNAKLEDNMNATNILIEYIENKRR